ncbi:HDOD domain-containing protein [Rhizobacter sp. AJA081-3]|uniref:serine/threonine protein kinase n=1 Tax=Rhizobacter sp. AJA081-3 TaxID=2753607 RepID=UPI001ADF0D0E|nr:HDOD domain-containing protein [Rhizobacter sp. AJA081-3]QTN25020.1 HDOD domain-containing protein [Rhizobacter sp. AJA081-3]
MATPATPATAAPRSSPTRAFGRFELRQLLGKSQGTMAWLAFDPRLGQEVMLTLPRVQPADSAALESRLREMKQAARLNHPNLAHVVEVGVQDHWPYVACDRALGVTLGEWLAAQPRLAPIDIAALMCHALSGLAFAHEAGVAHHDLQMHTLLVSPQGQVRVAALAAADLPAAAVEADNANERAMPMDPGELRAQRDAAQRDVLACGVLLHQMLAGAPVLDEPDVARVIDRMSPQGRDLVRLPWTTPQPVPEGLRAIANRCTASQERQRYRSARTLLRALEGWREVEAQGNGDPIALLIDRLRTVGHLPALPGITRRMARLSITDSQRTDEIAEQLLQDIALSFELLRTVNSAQVRGTQVAGNGPVLTLRRAIALLGVDGVRGAAQSLRHWPGPMNEEGAAALSRLMNHVRLAGHAAQALRPPGYDPEVAYLVAVLQNLGRLLVQYHFPEESEQIHHLMQPLPGPPGAPEHPGMSEESAAYAVLGTDIESLGAAVARHWGLGDEVQHMIRRLPAGKPVRTPDSDADMLRAAASAANEAVDAMTRLPAPRVAAALAQVAQRYTRVLELDAGEIREALQGARAALNSGTAAPAMKRGGTLDGDGTGTGELTRPSFTGEPAAPAARSGA